MSVTLAKEWSAVVPGGTCWPVRFYPGTVLDGELAEMAVAAGVAVGMEEPGARMANVNDPEALTAPNEMTINAVPPTAIANDPGARRVARAKLKDAYDGPDEIGAPLKLKKGVYVKGATAQHLVDIGAASVVEYEK